MHRGDFPSGCRNLRLMRSGAAFIVWVGFAAVAGAQTVPAPPRLVARSTDSIGIIRGIVRDSAAKPVRALIGIPERKLFVVADDSGRFRLVAGSGSVVLLTRALGMERRTDSLTLSPHQGLDREITMLVGRIIIESDCFNCDPGRQPAPAKLPGLEPPEVRSRRVGPSPVVTVERMASAADDSLALLIAVYGAAFSNGTRTAHAAALPELVCIRGIGPAVDPPAGVLEAMRRGRTILVRPMSVCRVEPPGADRRQSGNSLVIDTLTGKRGISIHASAPKFDSDSTFSFDTDYYQHGLSAGGFTCIGRRERGTWVVMRCDLRWIS